MKSRNILALGMGAGLAALVCGCEDRQPLNKGCNVHVDRVEVTYTKVGAVDVGTVLFFYENKVIGGMKTSNGSIGANTDGYRPSLQCDDGTLLNIDQLYTY